MRRARNMRERAATPRGTLEDRLRGSSCGSGANVTAEFAGDMVGERRMPPGCVPHDCEYVSVSDVRVDDGAVLVEATGKSDDSDAFGEVVAEDDES